MKNGVFGGWRHRIATILAVFGFMGHAAQAWAQDSCQRLYDAGRYPEAIRCWTLLAEQGVALAQYNLGVMYDNGRGVPQDDAKAFYWFTKAAEQGVAEAQETLGRMYLDGRGVPQDEKKALYWMERSQRGGR
jgi:TPR repeat protein